jgi:hypothetical protein
MGLPRAAHGRPLRRGRSHASPVFIRLDGYTRFADRYNHAMGAHRNSAMRLWFSLAVLACVLSTVGCSNKSKQAVVYPQSWPVPQLSAPPGSFQAPLPPGLSIGTDPFLYNAYIVNAGLGGSGRSWGFAFSSSLSWPQLNDWIDQQLKPAGYMLSWRNRQSPQIGAIQTYYVDTACTQFIEITSVNGVYSYKATVYDHAQDPQFPAFARMQPIP